MLFYLLFVSLLAMSFGPIGELPSLDDIQNRINERYNGLFHTDKLGNRHPYVCLVCDELLLCKRDVNFYAVDKFKKKLSWFTLEEAHPN
jgi:hypothetical protein